MKKNCCFTGHRKIARSELPLIIDRLRKTIEWLIQENNVAVFFCGGALAFDTMAGFVVAELREKFPSIKLVMVLPCPNQDTKWAEKDKTAYRKLLAAANEIIYVSEEYSYDCMKKRNARLVRDSDFCIAYMKRLRSGAAQTVRLAKEKGISVINLAEVDMP